MPEEYYHYVDKRFEDMNRMMDRLLETYHMLRDADMSSIEAYRKTVDERLHDANQFRDQIERERANFLDKARYEEKHEILEVLIDTIKDKLEARLLLLEKLQVGQDAINKDKDKSRRNIYAIGAFIASLSGAMTALLIHVFG